jgi:hypothetical protein
MSYFSTWLIDFVAINLDICYHVVRCLCFVVTNINSISIVNIIKVNYLWPHIFRMILVLIVHLRMNTLLTVVFDEYHWRYIRILHCSIVTVCRCWFFYEIIRQITGVSNEMNLSVLSSQLPQFQSDWNRLLFLSFCIQTTLRFKCCTPICGIPRVIVHQVFQKMQSKHVRNVILLTN